MFSLIIIDFKSIHPSMDYIDAFVSRCRRSDECHPIIIDNFFEDEAYPTELKSYGTISLYARVTDREVYEIKTESYKVYYCKYGGNAGFARGNNLGAKISRELFHDDYYLFSNNDITLSSEFPLGRYEQLMRQHPEIGVIGPRVKTPSGEEQSPCKKISSFYQLFGQMWEYTIPFVHVKGDLDYDGTSKKCYWVSGCFMFIRASAFDQVDGFDENTFLYAEEMILAERLASQNYVSYYDTGYVIAHLGGGTTKSTNSALKILKIRFNSICYYNMQYRRVSLRTIKLAKSNFKICCRIMKAKNELRKVFGKKKVWHEFLDKKI